MWEPRRITNLWASRPVWRETQVLSHLKDPVTALGIEPLNLPACTTVSQPTTLPRAPCQHANILVPQRSDTEHQSQLFIETKIV
jgi:hypothetical protein